MPTTSRGGLHYPSGSSAADVPADILSLANDLASVGAFYVQGVAASRPAATSTLVGYFYYATDTSKLSYCTGSAWVTINPAIAADAITATEIAANAVGASELADNAVDTAAIVAGAVTLGKYVLQYGVAVGSFTFSASDMASRAYAPSGSYSENDPNGWFSGTTQFVVPTTGTYLLVGTLDQMSAGSGRFKNALVANTTSELPGGNTASVHFAGDNIKGMPPAIVMASLTAGDAIDYFGFSENGGTARHVMNVLRLV